MPVRTLVSTALLLIGCTLLPGCAADAQKGAPGGKPVAQGANAPAPQQAPAGQTPAAAASYGSAASASTACMTRLQARLDTAAAAQRADSTRKRPGSGRDPVYAVEKGWYPKMPAFRDGSILPCSRVVAYYGNPREKKMGVLGEYPRDEMFRRFDRQVDDWRKADPATPVVPAFHLVSVVAQGDPGKSGKYRMIMPDTLLKEVYGWARQKNGIFIIDVQVLKEVFEY